MAHLRDPRTSIQSRLAADHHPRAVPEHERGPELHPGPEARDEREQTTPDPRPPGISGAETVAFVLALLFIVVLVALL